MNNKPYLYIVAASVFWSVQGVIGKSLAHLLMPLQLGFSRVFIGFLFILVYTLLNHRHALKIDLKGMVKMAGVGLVCQTTLNICFFYAVVETSVTAATTLLYTAPIFSMIIARFVFKDKFTLYKVTALLVCTVGCFLTVTMGKLALLQGSSLGLLAGVISGLAYAMNSIFGKKLMEKYNSWVILTYTFGFGSLFFIPFVNPISIIPHLFNLKALVGLLLLGFIPTFLAIACYFKGIREGAEPSKVGIVATLEVVLSITLASLLFSEPIGRVRILGIILIFVSVNLLYRDNLKLDLKTQARLEKVS